MTSEEARKVMGWFEFAVFVVKAIVELGLWVYSKIKETYDEVERESLREELELSKTMGSRRKRLIFMAKVWPELSEHSGNEPDKDHMQMLIDVAWRLKNGRSAVPVDKASIQISTARKVWAKRKLVAMNDSSVQYRY